MCFLYVLKTFKINQQKIFLCGLNVAYLMFFILLTSFLSVILSYIFILFDCLVLAYTKLCVYNIIFGLTKPILRI